MKRLLIVLMAAAAFAAAPSVYGQDSSVHDINISVNLTPDGSACISEVWDMNIYYGTEWYLVRRNLGDIEVKDLKVSDETGRQFINEGRWNVDRSIDAKAGRCGIVDKGDGCEICWGLGSYGSRTFTVEYTMTNAVKAMQDFDKLHLQLVSPGIQPYPEHIKVTVSAEGKDLVDENTGIWAFGYDGSDFFDDGSVVFETDSPFDTDACSVIVLCRFEKGLFQPTSLEEQDIPFQESLDAAFEGSAYQDYLDGEDDELGKKNAGILSLFTAFIALMIGFIITGKRKRNKNMLGVVKLKDIGYERELPFDGNLYETRYVLGKCQAFSSEGNMASALILRMINEHKLIANMDSNGKVLISFASDVNLGEMCESQRQFYAMLKEAAGEDGVLQEREFSRWARNSANQKLLSKWITEVPAAGASFLTEHKYGAGTNFTPEGQVQARRVIGFKKYLKDFTVINERKTVEVALWQEYLVYAALYGIADKVAKELKDIDPKAFQDNVGYPYPMVSRMIVFSDSMGSAIVSAAAAQSSSSVGGHGGHSSFGGGGGFSGGGFGGGAR